MDDHTNPDPTDSGAEKAPELAEPAFIIRLFDRILPKVIIILGSALLLITAVGFLVVFAASRMPH